MVPTERRDSFSIKGKHSNLATPADFSPTVPGFDRDAAMRAYLDAIKRAKLDDWREINRLKKKPRFINYTRTGEFRWDDAAQEWIWTREREVNGRLEKRSAGK